MFIGLKEDVELAKTVYGFAVNFIQQNTLSFVKQYKAQHSNYHVGIKNDYMDGWLAGLKSKYDEQVEKNNWGLVLVKDPVVQTAIEELNLKKGQGSSVISGSNREAYANGYKQGREFNSPRGMIK